VLTSFDTIQKHLVDWTDYTIVHLPELVDIKFSPRVASQSIKQYAMHMYFPAIDYIDYDDFIKHKRMFEQFNPTNNFRKNTYKIAVYRDPIDRFVSACNWDYCHWGKHPDFKDTILFADNFDTIFDTWVGFLSAHNKHYFPQTLYLNKRKDYDMVYNISDIDLLFEYLNVMYSNNFRPHVNETTIRHFNRDQLSVDQIEKLYTIYSVDYDNGWH
jgi:hypothetical protein